MLRNTALVYYAHSYAANCHASIDQRRKYTKEPYIVHPEAVANLVRLVPHSPEMIAAAYLHDVVEDTGVTFERLKKDGFGGSVLDLVYWLTDISSPEDGNRKKRKAVDRNHISEAPAEAQTIKLADLIDNSQSIIDHDPNFARVYLLEKRRLLNVLRKGEPYLWKMAMGLVLYGEDKLGIRNVQLAAER